MGMMAHQRIKLAALKNQHRKSAFTNAQLRGAMSCRNVNAAKQHANAVTRIEKTGNREKEILEWQTGVLSANKARVQSCVEPVSIPRAKRSNL